MIGKILQFIRRYVVLNKFLIKYYARGTLRTETLTKLYEYLSTNTEEVEFLCSSFVDKVHMVCSMKKAFSDFGYKHNRFVFECLLWVLLILENENFDLTRVTDSEFIKRLGNSHLG